MPTKLTPITHPAYHCLVLGRIDENRKVEQLTLRELEVHIQDYYDTKEALKKAQKDLNAANARSRGMEETVATCCENMKQEIEFTLTSLKMRKPTTAEVKD